jgi:hypothetical protein
LARFSRANTFFQVHFSHFFTFYPAIQDMLIIFKKILVRS